MSSNKERLAEYEKRPGFKEREAEAMADVRTAAIMDTRLDAFAVTAKLGLPPDLALYWLGKALADCGVLKATFTVTGRPS